MISSRIALYTTRCQTIRLTGRAASNQAGKDPHISQGHVADRSRASPNPQTESAQSGLNKGTSSSTPLDSATGDTGRPKASRDASGNPENVGLADQVGSQSGRTTKEYEGRTGEEESAKPGLFDTLKSKLGWGTTAGDVKQNRGGGEGVTGTGKVTGGKRGFNSSASARNGTNAKGQAPEGSRKPKESTHGEQNEHLKHKRAAGEPDKGKGNAGEDSMLPSQRK